MAFTPRTPFRWHLRTRSLELGPRTLLMGILNLTPDSFSNDGLSFHQAAALDRGLALLDEGADILDLGGESTRPGATPVSPEQEQARVLPVLRALLRQRPEAILSIDTYHAATAQQAADAGAEIVNDVSGMTWDLDMCPTAAALHTGVVLTHTRGRPTDWSSLPPLPPVAVMPIVLTGLRDALLAARRAGVPAERIVLDPGLGFGKRGPENFTVLALLEQLRQFGLPVMVGASRKGFLRQAIAEQGRPAPPPDSAATLHATLAAGTAAILAGAHILRVHQVAAAREAAAIADRLLGAAARLAQATASFTQGATTTPQ